MPSLSSPRPLWLLLPWPLLLVGCGTGALEERLARMEKDMLATQNRLDRAEERIAGLELAAARSGAATPPAGQPGLPVVRLVPEGNPPPAPGAGQVAPTEGDPPSPGASEPSSQAPGGAGASGATPAAEEPRPLIKIEGTPPKKGGALDPVPAEGRPTHGLSAPRSGHSLHEVG